MPKEQVALRAIRDAELSGMTYRVIGHVAILHLGRDRVRRSNVIFPPTYSALAQRGLVEVGELLTLTAVGRQRCEELPDSR